MGSLSMAMVMVERHVLAGISFNRRECAAERYDVMYADAFWSHRVRIDRAAEVASEELEIDRLMRGQDFVTARRGE